jgi:murein DD-endopeptidase MepM/ murein hydrolase activator NlpD
MDYRNLNLADKLDQHVSRRKPVAHEKPRKNILNNQKRPVWSHFVTTWRGSGLKKQAHMSENTGLPMQNLPARPAKAGNFGRYSGSEAILHSIEQDVEQNAAKNSKKWQSLAEKITPFYVSRILLSLIAGSALAIFAFNALLWQNTVRVIKPHADGGVHTELRAFISKPDAFGVPAIRVDEIPLELIERFEWKSYKVAAGDSVSRIAANEGLSMDAIVASNHITRARALREGEVLRIPNMDGIPITVRRGDSLEKLSALYKVPKEAILDANDLASDAVEAGASLFLPGARMKSDELNMVIGDLFIYPVKGRLISRYGWRDDPISGERLFHAAIDLAAREGVPVKSAMDGKVTSVGFNTTYGNFIIITHSSGYKTMYAHLAGTSVKENDRVEQGDAIGKVGATGYSTSAHLHFAIYKNDRSCNPLDYLKF